MSTWIPQMEDIVDYTAETDPNGKLGQKGWYAGKTDWTDVRAKGEYTLEVYADADAAAARAEYLEGFYGSVLCDYRVYRHGGYVLRVSNALSEADAQAYEQSLKGALEMKDRDFAAYN